MRKDTSCKNYSKESCNDYIHIKVNLREKKVTSNEEKYYIMIKASIHHEHITTLSVYVPTHKALKNTKQNLTELKGETDKYVIIIGNLNTPLLVINKNTRWNIGKDTEVLKQMDLSDLIQVTPPQSNRMHILFKHTWNSHHDR